MRITSMGDIYYVTHIFSQLDQINNQEILQLISEYAVADKDKRKELTKIFINSIGGKDDD